MPDPRPFAGEINQRFAVEAPLEQPEITTPT